MESIRVLTLIRDFISAEEEHWLVGNIELRAWSKTLKRLVQHYGYEYNYGHRRVKELRLGDLPSWLNSIAERIADRCRFDRTPDQAIVAEYEPGQGISAQIDCPVSFWNTIAIASLLSACEMCFESSNSSKSKIHLSPRSILVLQDEARFEWTHMIPARKSDVVNGIKVKSIRSLSITFRTVRSITR